MNRARLFAWSVAGAVAQVVAVLAALSALALPFLDVSPMWPPMLLIAALLVVMACIKGYARTIREAEDE